MIESLPHSEMQSKVLLLQTTSIYLHKKTTKDTCHDAI